MPNLLFFFKNENSFLASQNGKTKMDAFTLGMVMTPAWW